MCGPVGAWRLPAPFVAWDARIPLILSPHGRPLDDAATDGNDWLRGRGLGLARAEQVSRITLSVLFALVLTPSAEAGSAGSLGVTFSPIGAWAATRVGTGLTAGLSAGLDWDYHRRGAWTSMGGHIASSLAFTEATPLRVRWGAPGESLRPFIGIGASILLPWLDSRGTGTEWVLRLGGEASAGVEVPLGTVLFLATEGRYQNFSAVADPLSSHRQEIVSAYLGVGCKL